jgi:hypothetical protein
MKRVCGGREKREGRVGTAEAVEPEIHRVDP